MGYLSKELANDYQAVAPCFRSIGVDGYKLSDLKVEGVEESKTEYFVEIQMLDDMGTPVAYYDWWHGGRAPHNKGDGWYEGSTIIEGEDDVELVKGQGLWIQAVEGAYLVSSGEVLNENVLIELADDYQMVANPFPTSIGLSNVKVGGVEESKTEYFVEIQMLDDMGTPVAYYDWWHGGRAPHNKGDGWYEGSTIIEGEDDIELAPGQALWIQAVEGATITFNCPYDLSAK